MTQQQHDHVHTPGCRDHHRADARPTISRRQMLGTSMKGMAGGLLAGGMLSSATRLWAAEEPATTAADRISTHGYASHGAREMLAPFQFERRPVGATDVRYRFVIDASSLKA